MRQSGNRASLDSLPCQQSVLARMHDGFCFAVMVNTRNGDNFTADLHQLMWLVRQAINHWPDGEL